MNMLARTHIVRARQTIVDDTTGCINDVSDPAARMCIGARLRALASVFARLRFAFVVVAARESPILGRG